MFSNGIGQSVGTFKWLATICKRIRMKYEARAEQISKMAPSAATIFSLRPAHHGGSLSGGNMYDMAGKTYFVQKTPKNA